MPINAFPWPDPMPASECFWFIGKEVTTGGTRIITFCARTLETSQLRQTREDNGETMLKDHDPESQTRCCWFKGTSLCNLSMLTKRDTSVRTIVGASSKPVPANESP